MRGCSTLSPPPPPPKSFAREMDSELLEMSPSNVAAFIVTIITEHHGG